MLSKSKICCRTTTITLFVAVLLQTISEVQNLKCRTTDHSKRQGEFIDIAEQCKNATTTGERTSSLADIDYSLPYAGGQRYNGGNNRKTVAVDGRTRNEQENRRNSNRQFNVHRQEFAYNNNRDGSDYNNNYDRGNDGGDRSTTQCTDVHPQLQYSGYNRQNNNNGQRNAYYSSTDYDNVRQSDSHNYRQPPSNRRYRRNSKYYKNNRNLQKAATSGNRLLGNNRFRNVTKNIVNLSKGSILDKMDACTIHCVFNQLEMLNSNARPDKPSILNIMTNQIKDVELKEFIHDSIDECFDTLELDYPNNKCEFSKNFAVCMENKAQRNCDDWDENQKL